MADNTKIVADSVLAGATNAPVHKHSKFYFDGTLIFIKLENTLFNVHKSQLLKSRAFSKWFQLQESSFQLKDPERTEGLSPDNPIVLQGIEMSDFEAFLKVLYAPQFSNSRPPPKVALIISAYRMAVLWEFSELRDYLFSFANRSFNDVDRISFAKAFELKAWLLAPHVNLCQREEQLTLEEAKKIGVDSLLVINNLREEFPPRKLASDRELSEGCSAVVQQTSQYNPYPYSSTFMTPTSHVHCASCLSKHPWPDPETVKSTIKTRIKDWIDENL